MPDVGPALLAVLSALGGSLVTGLLHHLAARAERAEARADRLRGDRLDAVTALAVTLADHHRAMWELRHAELTDQPAERVQVLRDESHRTRSGITDPGVRVRLLIADDGVRTAAREATTATYAMRETESLAALQTARRQALFLHDDFVNAAGAHLA